MTKSMTKIGDCPSTAERSAFASYKLAYVLLCELLL